jgi:hypothetical protein
MNPLSDRAVVAALIATVGLVFALIFWTARLAPPADGPLQWRDQAPEAHRLAPPTFSRRPTADLLAEATASAS